MPLPHNVSVLQDAGRRQQLHPLALGRVHGAQRRFYMPRPKHQQVEQHVRV
jgi:hypothetical protein